ncbi:hypothetical protein SSPO_025080 [Streptomyces antimycoticus]|uniref:Uncharacterized protein n=1 Tax=Streptomyces antimycoticus TaxID=68175 RepID=A0A499UHV7_9ACTN|nr:hypothetical protein SSPO_025080 [Streptomyces antimycoticus]
MPEDPRGEVRGNRPGPGFSEPTWPPRESARPGCPDMGDKGGIALEVTALASTASYSYGPDGVSGSAPGEPRGRDPV